MKCKICGVDLILTKDNHYTAFVERDGFSSPFVIGAHRPDRKLVLYDCFDCPACGCQNIIQERKYTFDPETYSETEPNPVHSVYFKSEREADKFLGRLKKTLQKTGFVSYWDYKSILNRPPRWEQGFGWTSLDGACVKQNANGWYLAMPAVTNRRTCRGT